MLRIDHLPSIYSHLAVHLPSKLRVGACLSLTGRYERFGRQAADGLSVWQELDGHAELVVEDDVSDPGRLVDVFPDVARRCDLLLGPYSTQLMRPAAELAAAGDHLLWNHGGAGDGVQTDHPGHVVSVLTPATRYALPYLGLLGRLRAEGRPAPLWIAQGRGSFGNHVAAGAAAEARRLDIAGVRIRAGSLAGPPRAEAWDLLVAGTFEEDVATLTHLREMARPPRLSCSVAAGVSGFRLTPAFAPGTYGIAQWLPGDIGAVAIGPDEVTFTRRYRQLTGQAPDYPAVQAAAAAAIAVHCARQSGSVSRDVLWRLATSLRTDTLFGRFEVDDAVGAQVGHQTRLARWTESELRPVAL